jgi:acyl-CoA synthetase (NDP forming)
LLSASDVTVDALFKQAGVIRTDTMHELFDVGALLSAQPAPLGGRVAIVTNAGGPGIMCADACHAAGLEVVELSRELRERLAGFLAPEASLGNPVDMIATASAESYRLTIEALVQAGACDAIVAIFVPPLLIRAKDVARELRAAAAHAEGVALASVFMTSEGTPAQPGEGARVPSFEFPEDAARALGHAARYGRWRARPLGHVREPSGCRSDEAAAIVSQTLASQAFARGDGWLAPREVTALLDCYGLPLIATRVVDGAEEAVAADERGVELLMGVVHDESFGPVIACAAGGTGVEVLGDVQVRITPLTDLDAADMLRCLRTFPLLDGYRGAPACDVAALEDMLARLSALVEAHPEIAELDANPIIASPAGAVILDARIRLASVPPPRPLSSL